MTLGEGWVPVALSSSIETATSAGAVVDRSELVIWRDNSGNAHVWEDRCPHRGMRLSFGFVRGDHIACLYHGWQYDSAGQCRHIPAHPALEVPQTIKVQTYRSQEKYGIIWATTAVEAALPEIGAASGATPVRSLYIDRQAEDVRTFLASAGLSDHGGNIAILSADGDTLLVAVQAIGQTKTGVHIVILGAPDANTGAKQKRYSSWAETARRTLEDMAEVA